MFRQGYYANLMEWQGLSVDGYPIYLGDNYDQAKAEFERISAQHHTALRIHTQVIEFYFQGNLT